METVASRMEVFPPGAWDLHHYDDLVEWLKEIKPIPGTTAITQSLRSLSGRFEVMDYRADAHSEDEEPINDDARPHLSPKGSKAREETEPVVEVLNDTTVLLSFASPILSDLILIVPSM